MAAKRPSAHGACFHTLAGLVLLVCATAYLHAQSTPGPRASAVQPATTQPAVANERGPAVTRPAPAGERQSDVPAAARTRDDPEPRREPSASEILRELTKQARRPGRPIVRPSRPGWTARTTVSRKALPANAIRPPEKKLLPDGYRIVDRPGRLTREGDLWLFSFESRGRGAPELPIRLLPNRLLEDMEVFSAGGTKPVVFIVSGEITEYHNVNYLLVQKLLTRPDLGNLD